MFGTLPNTPYFRSLQSKDILDISSTGQMFNRTDKVDFTKPNRFRRDLVRVQGRMFFVALREIEKNCWKLAQLLRKGPVDISTSSFEILLRFVCPNNSGLYRESLSEENLLPLLLLSHKLGLDQIGLQCQKFLSLNRIKELPVVQLITAFDCVDEQQLQTRSCLLKSILEHGDLFSVLLNSGNTSSLPSVPMIRRAVQNLKRLEHNASFVNTSAPIRCQCPKEPKTGLRLFERRAMGSLPASFCGLLCSDCEFPCCSGCRNSLCLAKIGQFLIDYTDNQSGAVENEEEEDLVYSPTVSEEHTSIWGALLDDPEPIPQADVIPQQEIQTHHIATQQSTIRQQCNQSQCYYPSQNGVSQSQHFSSPVSQYHPVQNQYSSPVRSSYYSQNQYSPSQTHASHQFQYPVAAQQFHPHNCQYPSPPYCQAYHTPPTPTYTPVQNQNCQNFTSYQTASHYQQVYSAAQVSQQQQAYVQFQSDYAYPATMFM